MASFGITIVSASGVVVESADVEMKSEFKQLINSDGTNGGAKAYDTTYSFNAKGKGDTCPFTIGSGTGAPSDVEGKAIWTNVTLDTKNDDFHGWSASGTGYKHA
jgi:hypothetical protein